MEEGEHPPPVQLGDEALPEREDIDGVQHEQQQDPAAPDNVRGEGAQQTQEGLEVSNNEGSSVHLPEGEHLILGPRVCPPVPPAPFLKSFTPLFGYYYLYQLKK